MAKSIYLSGPITGLPEEEYKSRFAKAEEALAAQWTVMNPVKLGATLDMFHALAQLDKPTWANYMKADIVGLVTCDAIAMLPDWQSSKGARVELSLALSLGLEVYDATTAERLYFFQSDLIFVPVEVEALA